MIFPEGTRKSTELKHEIIHELVELIRHELVELINNPNRH